MKYTPTLFFFALLANWFFAQADSAGLPQIALLGVFHFAGTTDYSSVDFGPLTSEKRQEEIRQVVEKLKAYRPTKVLLEYPAGKAQRLDSLYRAYLKGGYELSINEIDQLGFRLERQLGHPSVYAVDHELPLPFGPFMAFDEQYDKDRLDAFLRSIEEQDEKESRYLQEHTILDYLIYRNTEEEDLRNKNLYIDETAKFINDTTYIGIDFTVKWWERNFYIMGNIDRVTGPGDRLLVIIGAGHRAVLKGFFEDRRDVEYVEIRKYLE